MRADSGMPPWPLFWLHLDLEHANVQDLDAAVVALLGPVTRVLREGKFTIYVGIINVLLFQLTI